MTAPKATPPTVATDEGANAKQAGTDNTKPLLFAEAAPRIYENGYAPVPIEGKRPVAPDWPRFEVSADSLQLYGNRSTGILTGCGSVYAFDVDCPNGPVAKAIHDYLRQQIGESGTFLVRAGAAPKFAVLVRCAALLNKRATARFVDSAGEATQYQVEFLGAGQQLAAFSIHPVTGEPYKWYGGSPLSVPAADLPVITESQVTEIIAACEAIFHSHGLAPVSGIHNKPQRVPSVNAEYQVSQTPPTLDRLAEIATHIGTETRGLDGDYDQWITCLLAIKATYPGDEGLDVARRLSKHSPRFDESELRSKWDSLNPTSVSIGTLFHVAEQHGWGTSVAPGKTPTVVCRDDFPITYRRLSEVESKPIRWLWRGRFARGKVNMVAGNPGLGKSQLTAAMAAIVSTGGNWPVDKSACEAGNVILLSAEDNAEDTIRPRLQAAGANLSKIVLLDAVRDGFSADGSPTLRAFNLKSDVQVLGALCEVLRPVHLIVIDPITAYLGETDSHRNAEVRALLSPLSELAAKHDSAVVCVSHLSKSGQNDPVLRTNGSVAFVAAARAAWLVAKDPKDSTGRRRVMLPTKNNVGTDQGGLAFVIDSVSLGNGIDTSRVLWEPNPVTMTADEALAPRETGNKQGAMDDVRAWLQERLADGPVPVAELKEEAKGRGSSWTTVQRAKDGLGIKATRHGFGKEGGWTWQL